ncbi:hypothetical protein [Streptomyces sp. NPDC048057]|uniref:hypothetical protein n=1 Tax=Streptomyces sp. NPDC048057 TaxID=3155628 RepID=UPI0033C3BC96
MSRVVLPGALALAVVVAGATYVTTTASGADRSPATEVWAEGPVDPAHDPVGDLDNGRTHTPLSKQLLPVPNLYKLGPDRLGHGGNDGELSGAQAAERIKRGSGGDGLSGSDRREFERNVDRLGVEGVAWRTYGSAQFTHVVDVSLTRFGGSEKARALYVVLAGVAERLGLDALPAVDGHEKNTSCHSVEAEAKEDLREFLCWGYAGGTNVTLRAYGKDKLSPSEVVDFMKQQMDHLASPQEAV